MKIAIRIKMQLIKEHKVLAEYAQVDDDGAKLTRPVIQPIYVRKSDLVGAAELPAFFEVSLEGETTKEYVK
jgi:hypothetical protein